MSLFQPTYRDKDGKARKVDKWWIEIRDHNKIKRRFPGFADKSQTRKLEDKIKKLIVCKLNNEPPDRELSEWLRAVSPRLSGKLLDIGLLDRKRAAAGKPLAEHLEDFRNWLAGKTETHIRITCARISSIFDGCKFNYWAGITASEAKGYLTGLDISTKTFNYYYYSAM